MRYMDLTDRVAIVTGAAQGIGLAIAERLAAAGASVALADVNADGVQKATNSLKANSANATAFSCNVSELNAVQNMVISVLDKYKQIDILVNNAAIHLPLTPIQDITDDYWDRTIAIDLTGVFYCCREVIPHMIKRRTGRIINISSIAAKEGRPKTVPYSAAKAGVIGLTKALAKEVAQYKILVNAVTPGLTQTSMGKAIPNVESVIDQIPMGRMCHPEEVAAIVHWLASEEVSFSTGAVFDISGGRAAY